MAWQTPPTFTDTDVLSAAQLNIIRDDLEYLYGLSQSVNIASVASRTDGINYRYIRHRLQYLHIQFNSENGSGLAYYDYEVKYNGAIIISGSTTAGGGGANETTTPTPVDLDVSPGSLTVGMWYPILITVTGNGTVTGNYFETRYTFESESAS